MKCAYAELFNVTEAGHSPHGECGLKYDQPAVYPMAQVTPRMGSAG